MTPGFGKYFIMSKCNGCGALHDHGVMCCPECGVIGDFKAVSCREEWDDEIITDWPESGQMEEPEGYTYCGHKMEAEVEKLVFRKNARFVEKQ